MSKSYTIEFNGTGEVSEGSFRNDTEAVLWVESVLEARGCDADEIVSGDWDSDGQNDDGERCERMLFWANEAASENDPGVNAVCKLCVVR
jgi:hypothetical protein